MTITNQNVKIFRGDTATLAVALTQVDGSPFDPTIDVKLKWRVARNWYSPESNALIRKDLGDGIDIISGGIAITLFNKETDLVPGLYYHELKVFDFGDVSTSMTGTIIIRRALHMGDVDKPGAAVIQLHGDLPDVVTTTDALPPNPSNG